MKSRYILPFILIVLCLLSCQTTNKSEESLPLNDVLNDNGRKWSAKASGLSEYEWDNAFTEPISNIQSQFIDNEIQENIAEDSTAFIEPEIIKDFNNSQQGSNNTTEIKENNVSSHNVEILPEIIEVTADADINTGNVSILKDPAGTSLQNNETSANAIPFDAGAISLAGESVNSPYPINEEAFEVQQNQGNFEIIKDETEPVYEDSESIDPNSIFEIGIQKIAAANEKPNGIKNFLSNYGGIFILAFAVIGFIFALRYAVVYIWSGGGLYANKEAGNNEISEPMPKENSEVETTCYEISNIGAGDDDSDLIEPEEEKQYNTSGTKNENPNGSIDNLKLKEALKRDEMELQERENRQNEIRAAKKLSDLLSIAIPEKSEESYQKVIATNEDAIDINALVDSISPARPGEESYPEVLDKYPF